MRIIKLALAKSIFTGQALPKPEIEEMNMDFDAPMQKKPTFNYSVLNESVI